MYIRTCAHTHTHSRSSSLHMVISLNESNVLLLSPTEVKPLEEEMAREDAVLSTSIAATYKSFIFLSFHSLVIMIKNYFTYLPMCLKRGCCFFKWLNYTFLYHSAGELTSPYYRLTQISVGTTWVRESRLRLSRTDAKLH